ncbi:hypothetical protein JHK87_050730 [Glycine soja]|nr:hypothetical protein JHK87_050730 [Glycine soja]
MEILGGHIYVKILGVLECIRIPEHKGKKWSTFSLVLWVLFFLTLILVLLVALGIVYLPTTDDDFPTTDLNAFRRKTSQSGESLVENSEQWTEILSWEPRAFIYHNFLAILDSTGSLVEFACEVEITE